MKNIEISEKLFREYFMPVISKELPEAIPYFAAGLVGEGSDCFGYDDDVSLDHDCDVRLYIWMDTQAKERYGSSVQRLLQKMPGELCERPTDLETDGRSGITATESFYQRLLGKPQGPQTINDWMEAEEVMLATAVNGKVFTETLVLFTSVRERLLQYYPEDIRLIRLSKAIGLAAQSGQYNYMRILKRNDKVAAEMAKSIFIESVVQAVFLLEKTYRPFYKWAFRKMRELGEFGTHMADLLSGLYDLKGTEACVQIEEISGKLIDAMRRQGLSEGSDDFLMGHIPELAKHVEDKSLLEKGIILVR